MREHRYVLCLGELGVWRAGTQKHLSEQSSRCDGHQFERLWKTHMNFFEAIKSGFRNLVNFKDRAIRSEYWYWTLFATIVSVGINALDLSLNPGDQLGLSSAVNGIVSIGLFIPGLAVSVRRLHDIDRTGWWLLLCLTVIGILLLLYWAFLRGTPGPNRFGPDPLHAKHPPQ
jgi:uncharacterized membrane protein YhaH (DUF805 family)